MTAIKKEGKEVHYSGGKSYYLNLTPVEYTDISRRDSSYGTAWQKLIRGILEENGFKPRLEIKEAVTRVVKEKATRLGNARKAKGEPVIVEVVGTKELPVMESLFWKKGDVYYLCVVRNASNYGGDLITGKVSLQGLDSKIKELYVELSFRDSVKKIKNLKTGKELGEGTKFTDIWKAFEANVYEVEFKTAK